MKKGRAAALFATGAGAVALLVGCDPAPVSPMTSYSGADLPNGGGPNVGLSVIDVNLTCTAGHADTFQAEVFGYLNGLQVATEQTLPGLANAVNVACTGSQQTITLITVDPTDGGLYKAGATSAKVTITESGSDNATFTPKTVSVVLNAHYPLG
jgi:hypothetical protein